MKIEKRLILEAKEQILGSGDKVMKETNYPTERPIHEPDQVINISQLIPGKTYLAKNIGLQSPKKIRFESMSEDGRRARVKLLNSGLTIDPVVEISLADRCVIPYDMGAWNPTNYLVPCIEDSEKKR